nr:alcohol dehydrogenase catalytic domain-containing protein [Micromonospora coriariae]
MTGRAGRGWQGYDPDVRLPHVPGHELAGVVTEVGAGIRGWRRGDRVTAPFVCACGQCPACVAGDHTRTQNRTSRCTGRRCSPHASRRRARR